MDFHTFHLYNRLARRRLVKPLTHSCGNEFLLTIGKDDAPVLKCVHCNTLTFPGLKMYSDIEAVVKEHFA